jgi:hypothetical protein
VIPVLLLAGTAAVLAWWALHRRRPRVPHQLLTGRELTGRHQGALRAWCAHPSCRFDVDITAVWEDEQAFARQAYTRFHRGGGR